MDEFWKSALKVGGVIAVGLFVFWSLAKDMIPKFSMLNSAQTLFLAGVIIFLIFIVVMKLINKNAPSNKADRNSSVTINGDNHSGGNIITGDGNSINSDKEPKSANDQNQGSRDSSVSVGGSNSGNIVTGDGNSIG
ncbi:MAG TPA: hypothetical protein ENK91_08530 [Bacteroidetes bacterium]|nr:hypothetical protein [Bacteroidota bacterium]